MFGDDIAEIIEERELSQLFFELCLTLYYGDMEHAHIGGLLRAIGIEQEIAIKYDDAIFYFDEEFAEKVKEFETLQQFQEGFDELDKDIEELEEIRERIRKSKDDEDVPPTVH